MDIRGITNVFIAIFITFIIMSLATGTGYLYLIEDSHRKDELGGLKLWEMGMVASMTGLFVCFVNLMLLCYVKKNVVDMENSFQDFMTRQCNVDDREVTYRLN